MMDIGYGYSVFCYLMKIDNVIWESMSEYILKLLSPQYILDFIILS